MLPQAPNVDGVFLALKYATPEDQLAPLREPFQALLARLNRVLEGRAGLGAATDPLHADLFALRLKAIAAWAESGEVDMRGKLDRLAHELMEKATTQERALLVRHMCFALDVQRGLVDGLDDLGVDLDQLDTKQVAPLLKLEMPTFLDVLRAHAPTPEAAVQLEKWMRASFRTELGLLMGDAVLNEEVRITASRWYQVNAFLLDAAQELKDGAQLLSQFGPAV